MKDKLLEILKKHLKKTKTIALLEIQQQLPGDTQYEEFAKLMEELEKEEILVPIKKHGSNGSKYVLYNTYRINKEKLKMEFIEEIHRWQRKVDAHINLSSYLSLSEKEWKEDLYFIKKIDTYFKEKGLPKEEATSPERAYEIVHNEKWIDEGGGKKLLERIKVWEYIKISKQADPLMLAVNKKALQGLNHQHLIVENKSTFYLLLGFLNQTQFTSLIYGAGWKIVAGIEGVYKQLDIESEKNTFYYFGDIDYEGIAIYESISDKAKLAVSFYEALLQGEKSLGKENQERREEVLKNFVTRFSYEQGLKIKEVLEGGYYYPQEALCKEEVLNIWRALS
ncbi:DUF2220 family protein [Cellulosilyticum sp. ST5]|uniref:Wadjet anti-phage system protein JetD domain-containing protein n=1 Tax=Cellulosilyticum sp. ST5 TaxID=3055805 RepID=UPI00397764B7